MGLISRRAWRSIVLVENGLRDGSAASCTTGRRAAVHCGSAVDDRVHLRSGPGGSHFEDLSMTLR